MIPRFLHQRLHAPRIGTCATAILIALAAFRCGNAPDAAAKAEARIPRIQPDYSSIVIPPNIAPLNFRIDEPGARYSVRISGRNGKSIVLHSGGPGIMIPQRQWRSLLAANAGGELRIAVGVRDRAGWRRFADIVDTVAAATIDPYLVYRKIPICQLWQYMGIYQRRVNDFSESIVLHNTEFGGGCVNCHSFRNNDPGNMDLQIRSDTFGTPMLLCQSGRGPRAVTTKTPFTSGRTGFTAWHPTADIIAFSINGFSMIHHFSYRETREVFDESSDLALYMIDSEKVMIARAIAGPGRVETMPEWSRDGKFLYFCSGPQVSRRDYRSLRCDLMRIAWDPARRAFGKLDTVLCADSAGGSITQPRFSPDGRFLLFTVSEYSDFPIHQVHSDLHMMDMITGKHFRLSINSDRCQAWHGWSSNGRWIVFNSKAMDGRFSRIFFSHVDSAGVASKPFVLPQRDPEIYFSSMLVYNVPELITRPIAVPARKFREAMMAFDKKRSLDAVASASAEEYRDEVMIAR